MSHQTMHFWILHKGLYWIKKAKYVKYQKDRFLIFSKKIPKVIDFSRVEWAFNTLICNVSHDISNFSMILERHDVWFLMKVPETVANCYHNCLTRAWNTRLIVLASFSYPQEHVNFVGRDGENGPVLVSVKAETVAGQEHWRVLLRLRAGSTHDLVPASNLSPNPTPTKMVKVMATWVTVVLLRQWSLTVGV